MNLKPLFENLPEKPKHPIMGRGYKRIEFKAKMAGLAIKALWDAIPREHKYTSRYGGTFRYISPEANEILIEFGKIYNALHKNYRGETPAEEIAVLKERVAALEKHNEFLRSVPKNITTVPEFTDWWNNLNGEQRLTFLNSKTADPNSNTSRLRALNCFINQKALEFAK